MKKGFIAATIVVLSVFFTCLTVVCAEQKLTALKVLSCEASTTQSTDLPQGEANAGPANAIDNNPTTRWGSEFADNQWLILQLAKKSNIKKISISWEKAAAKAYKVLVSNDKETWKEIFSTENSPGGQEDIVLDKAVKAKYVKLDLKTRSTEWGFSIVDIVVMGN